MCIHAPQFLLKLVKTIQLLKKKSWLVFCIRFSLHCSRYIKSIFTFTTCHLRILEWSSFAIAGSSLFDSHLYSTPPPPPLFVIGTASTVNSGPFLFLCQMLLFMGNWRHMFTRDRNRNTIKTSLIDDLAYSTHFPVVLLIYRTQRLIRIYIACISPDLRGLVSLCSD